MLKSKPLLFSNLLFLSLSHLDAKSILQANIFEVITDSSLLHTIPNISANLFGPICNSILNQRNSSHLSSYHLFQAIFLSHLDHCSHLLTGLNSILAPHQHSFYRVVRGSFHSINQIMSLLYSKAHIILIPIKN